MQPNPDDPNDEEDRAWLEQNLTFRTKKQECLSCFDFSQFQQARSSQACANSEISLICTLGHVKFINSLSAALLMEIGMHMAFTETCNLKEHIKICNVIQHAAWDCIVTLCRNMDELGVRGMKIQILNFPGNVVAAVMHKLASGHWFVP